LIRQVLFGAIAGALAWVALQPLLLFLPTGVRFGAGWFLFTVGPGLLLGARLTRDLGVLQRTIVILGLGSAALPVMVEILGRLGQVGTFPYLALACAGGGFAMAADGHTSPKVARQDFAAAVLIVALALGMGAVVFSHRLIETTNGTELYGDYDSFDLSHYASWASDATHTVPPRAAFYSGHGLNAAYYPQMVLTMVHRFAGVGLLPIYFRYAWPAFLALGGLTVFALARLLAPAGAALLASVLVMVGGDFSYLAAWLLPHATIQWDYVLWPTNFLSPTMEVLQFNTWGPALPIFMTALYALVQHLRTGSRHWLLASAFVTAALFQFKPFAYIVLMAGLGCAFLFAGRDWTLRRRLAAMAFLTAAFTVPLVYGILTMPPEDRRSHLLPGFFMLPQRMLIKLDLTDAFVRVASRVSPVAAVQTPVFLLLATVLFLAGGLGVRWLGARLIWRALRGTLETNAAAWRVLAWIAVAGIAIPFVLVTEPYVDTLQFHQTGLYVLWIFAAISLASLSRRGKAVAAVAVVLALAAATPSSIHYVARKWNDNQRPGLADLSQSELRMADFLRTQNAESTVILHDNPTAPSLLAIVAERRVVLGWGRAYYAVGSESRVRDVDGFFRSESGAPDAAMDVLRRYRVTHVVVRLDRDRVHPEVLARLTPLLSFPDTVLYAVPSD
jgi:hypothetical protein